MSGVIEVFVIVLVLSLPMIAWATIEEIRRHRERKRWRRGGKMR